MKQKRSKSPEDWKNSIIIPLSSWGGDYQQLELVNTCTIDNFLQILYLFYTMDVHEMRKLFDSDHDTIKKHRWSFHPPGSSRYRVSTVVKFRGKK